MMTIVRAREFLAVCAVLLGTAVLAGAQEKRAAGDCDGRNPVGRTTARKKCESRQPACDCEVQRYDCRGHGYWGLSQATRDDLALLGVSQEQWDALCNNQRLGFFNVLAAIKQMLVRLDPTLKLEELGLRVDWDPGKGVQQDRVYFRGSDSLYSEIAELGDKHFSPDIFNGREHGEYFTSLRYEQLHKSLQVSFAKKIGSKEKYSRLDSDLDIFNPNIRVKSGLILGSLLHGFEVLSNKTSKVLGWGGKTSPYNVGNYQHWECKK